MRSSPVRAISQTPRCADMTIVPDGRSRRISGEGELGLPIGDVDLSFDSCGGGRLGLTSGMALGEPALNPIGHAETRRRGRTIERRRLLARYEAAEDVPITLITAPSGYGKSVLLDQIEALEQGRGRGTGRIVAPAPAVGRPAQANEFAERLSAFQQAAAGRGAPAMVLVDDAQNFPAGVLQGLLIEASNVRWVIASRGEPDLRLGRTRALDQLLEFRVEDLAFSDEEAEQVQQLEDGADTKLSFLSPLRGRLLGWAAGYRLLDVARRRSGSAAPAAARSAIAAVFDEEVIGPLPVGTQVFLERISILADFDPELCGAVSGEDDPTSLLSACRRAGVFILPAESEGSSRLHPLFAEHLRTRLEARRAGEVATLHERALGWLEARGRHGEAFEHALAVGDDARAAKLLNAYCISLLGQGLERDLAVLAGRLPPDLRRLYPDIGLGMALQLILGFQLEKADRVLGESARRIEELKALGEVQDEEAQRLEALQAHREMMLSLARGNLPLARELCGALMRRYGDSRSKNRLSVFASMIHTQLEQYNFQELERLYLVGKSEAYRIEDDIQYLPLERLHARYLFLTGRTGPAISALQAEVAKAEARFGSRSEFGALAALNLAEALYETDRTGEAAALVERYLPAAESYGFVDSVLTGRLTAARLHRLAGRPQQAMEALQRPLPILEETAAQLHDLQIAERIHWLLLDGRGAAAAEAARELGLDESPRQALPKGPGLMREEARALAWVRLARAQGRLAPALHVCQHWRSLLAQRRAAHAVVRWDLTIASVLALQGETRAARRTVWRAITAAAPGRFLRTFLDEGPLLAALLPGSESGQSGDGNGETAFVQALLDAARREFDGPGRGIPPEAQAPVARETLTATELRVLGLVATGQSNREIGDALGMTEGTVKWRMQGLYRKLGVRRRAYAVATAQRLGLVSRPG